MLSKKVLAQTFTLLTVTLISGTVNSDVFYQWVTCELLPIVPSNAVIVMDNASFHKRKDIREAITGAGFDLLFLPTYSPDLNPIEHKWAQAKAIRKAERCDTETLFSKHVA